MDVFLWTVAFLLVFALVCFLAVWSFNFFDSGDWPLGIAAGLLAFVTTAGGIALAVELDGEQLPPNGCYRIEHNKQLVPIVAGKVTTVSEVDDVQFYPIRCNG